MDTELKKLVIKEAKALKENAYPHELAKLSISTFDPTTMCRCVYGQMTGVCTSKRAHKLINMCCQRVFDVRCNDFHSSQLNGNPKGLQRWTKGWIGGQHLLFISPIERFIYQNKNARNGNNVRLLKYLKGEIKTLVFK